MAGLAKLFVEIDADISKLERSLKRAEKELMRAGQNMQKLGDNLARSLTLPILGIGVAAIKSAGDIEKLEKALTTTMRDAGYSTQSATEELAKLQKAAEAPGLDFEQAVKGSLRLQSVGFSAEEARRILVEFGNGVAAAGGSADELNRVTVQLSQIQGKGKILNEDLMILKENMPSVSKAMLDAFGTADAEGLRKLGISTEEFISRLTDQLAKMQRVEGGISNSIVNAGVSIKMFLASVGKSLDETFNVRGNIDAFAKGLTDLGTYFAGLDGGTKRVAATIGIFIAGLGPLIKVAGLVGSAFGTVTAAFIRFQLFVVGLSQTGLPGLIKQFTGLNAVMKANIIGIVITALAALTGAIVLLNKEMTAQERVTMAVRDAEKQAIQQSAEQRIEATKLVDILKSETATRGEKEAALKRLNALAPDIFKNIDIEKSKTDDLNKALGVYIERIQQRAKVAALNEKLIDQQKKLIELEAGVSEAVKPTLLQSVANYASSLGNIGTMAIKQGATVAKNTTQQIEGTKKQVELLSAEIAKLEPVVANQGNTQTKTNKATSAGATATGDLAKKTKEAKEAAEEMAAAQQKLREEREKDTAVQALPQASIGGASPQLPDMSRVISQHTDAQEAMRQTDVVMMLLQANAITTAEAFDRLGLSTVTASEIGALALRGFTESFTADMDAQKQGVDMFTKAIGLSLVSVAGAMSSAAENGATSLKELGKAAVSAGAKIIRSFIMQGVAGIVSKSLATAPFPLGLALGAAAGAAAGALFNRLLNGLKVPALADGAVAFGPTLAMVGDNVGARANPEVIAPLDKLKAMMGGGDGSGSGFIASTRVDGRDLLIILEKAQKDKRRAT